MALIKSSCLRLCTDALLGMGLLLGLVIGLASASPAPTSIADASGLHGLGWLPSDVFETGEGLPDPTVTAIATQHDGQVWIGTMRGLARQSGVRMLAEHGPGNVLDRQILDLLVTADDSLLVSVDSGGIWRLRNGRWASLGSPFDERRVQRLRAFPSAKGERIFAMGGGVAELQDGQWRAWPLPSSLAGREIFDLALEPARAGQPQRSWLVLKWRERQLRLHTKRLGEMVQQRTAELKGREQELQQLNEELLRLSYTDPLTGLGNRRHLFETMSREWQGGIAACTPLSVLMMDLDHFKAFNDHHGHQAGDARLQQVAGILLALLPVQATVARYGGEEFCVVLPRADAAEALRLGDSLRAAIAALTDTDWDASRPGFATTTSIGVATTVPSQEHRMDDLIADADHALYAAKHAGRNCIRSTASSS